LANRSHPQIADISVTLANVIYKKLSKPALLGNLSVVADQTYLSWTKHRATSQQLESLGA